MKRPRQKDPRYALNGVFYHWTAAGAPLYGNESRQLQEPERLSDGSGAHLKLLRRLFFRREPVAGLKGTVQD